MTRIRPALNPGMHPHLLSLALPASPPSPVASLAERGHDGSRGLQSTENRRHERARRVATPEPFGSCRPFNRRSANLPRLGRFFRGINPKAWCLGILARRFPSPGGRFENSPAFQRWVRWPNGVRPEGTAESSECHAFVPFPLLWEKFIRPFGTRCPYWTIPPLKGWATLNSPSGRRKTNSLCRASTGGPKNVQTSGGALRAPSSVTDRRYRAPAQY